jgi:integrase
MIRALTDRFVAGAHPTGRFVNVFDTKTRGLALRVGARTKVWYFTYRNNGPSQWLRLGEYPTLSLSDARARAERERGRLADGVDPVEEKQKAAEPPPPAAPVFTFADFVPVFVRFQQGRTKHWADEEGKIRRYLLPAWGALPLNAITRVQVTELLDTVENKGLTAGTNRIQAVISRMFTVALNRGLVDAHPAARIIKRFKEQARDRVLTDDELRSLWTALDSRPGAASDAIHLRLLLGQRGAETAEMLWSELDLEGALWTLPRLRTKTQKRAHLVALPPTALTLLEHRRTAVGQNEPRVFPGLTLTSKEHKALGSIPNGAYEWKDLRRTVATRLADLGFDETVIGRVLNHARVTITAKHYNQHTYVEEIRQALTAWDAELQRILANEPKSKTRVLPMRSRLP